MSAGTSHHVHTGRKVSECVRTREEGKEIDGLLGQGKRREKREGCYREGGSQLSAGTHLHVQTGSKVSMSVCKGGEEMACWRGGKEREWVCVWWVGEKEGGRGEGMIWEGGKEN